MEEVLANIMDLLVLGMDGVLLINFETCFLSRLFPFPFLPTPTAPPPGKDLEFLLLGGDFENWLPPPGGPDPLLVMALLIPPPFVEVENLLL